MATPTTSTTPDMGEDGVEVSQKIASRDEQNAIAQNGLENDLLAIAKIAASALKEKKQNKAEQGAVKLTRAGSDSALAATMSAVQDAAAASSKAAIAAAAKSSDPALRISSSMTKLKKAGAKSPASLSPSSAMSRKVKAKLRSSAGTLLQTTPETEEVLSSAAGAAQSPAMRRAAWTAKPSATDTALDVGYGPAAVATTSLSSEETGSTTDESVGATANEDGAAAGHAEEAPKRTGASASASTTKKRRGSVYTDLMTADKGRFLFRELMGSPVSGGLSEPESASSVTSSSDPRGPGNRRLTATPSMLMLSEAFEALSESPSALAPMDVHSTGGVYQLRRQAQAAHEGAHDRGYSLRRQAAYGASHAPRVHEETHEEDEASNAGPGRHRARSWTSSLESQKAAAAVSKAKREDLGKRLLSGCAGRKSEPEAPTRRVRSSGIPHVRFAKEDGSEASTWASTGSSASTSSQGNLGGRLDFSAEAIAARRSGSADTLGQQKWRPPAVETSRKVLSEIFADAKGEPGTTTSPPSNASLSKRPMLRRGVSRSGSLRTLRRSGNASRVAVFKPEDEETGADKVAAAFGAANPDRPGLVVGGGSKRERAAYLLDSNLGRFSSVPETALVMSKLPRSSSTPEEDERNGEDEVVELDDEDDENVTADKIVAKLGKNYRTKRGSLQRFMENDGSAEDRFDLVHKASAQQVHKIGILDLRIFNTDRHGGNILCSTKGGRDDVHLIPIDHALSLPDWHFLAEAYFDWQYWAQAQTPFDEKTKAVIASIDLDKDVRALQDLGLPESCIATNQIATLALQIATRNGFTLKDLGSMFQRPFCAGHNLHNKYFSPLEHMIILACEACHGPPYEPAGTHTDATTSRLYAAALQEDDADTDDESDEHGQNSNGDQDANDDDDDEEEDEEDDEYDIDAKERAAYGNCPPPPGFFAAFRTIVDEHTANDSWRDWLSPLNTA
ncbi:Phosphatidylinositol 4-kinase gamma 4 [Hondaea fermentalgiana]|uniref:Phosphatidylinositol 4-kinase gamma 4 n=1 Tax=Hondaea fermentalgiana TaxID=2315210 RepID=A0A2R5GRK3_9STRA|nr:Phosphatidylinositol 4-kinase gamma 4 [Hondaea fermentalgiana]|eukprot:GBG32939.1 Phosphatidylinositol 4-kinase gamma 4 [Hondaea fermentalgiana]